MQRHRPVARPLVAVLVLAAAVIVWPAQKAAAYEPGPLGPVPLTWAGGGAAGGAIGTMALAPTALGGVGAGTAFVAFPATVTTTAVATFGAGLAVGYLGAAAACAGITAVSDFMLADSPCEPYEFVGPTAPVGVASTGWYGCGGVQRCQTISWASLPDFAHGSTRFAAAPVDKNLYPLNSTARGTAGFENNRCTALPIWGPLPYATAPNLTTCGPSSGHTSATSGAPYAGGWTTVGQARSAECIANTPGFRNCGIWPGDMWWIGRLVGSEPKFDAQTMYASGIAVDPAVDERGLEARLVFRAECWNGTGYTNRSATGDWAFEDEIIILPLNPCHDGETTTQIDIDWQTNRGLTAAAPNRLTVPSIITWDAPPEWSNPTWPHKDKVKKRDDVATIPTLEVNEDDECEWGGDVVLMSWCTDTPLPEIVPDTDVRIYPDEAPSPTTTVPGTPTTTPTTTPDPCAGGAPSTSCTPPVEEVDPEPGESGECFPSGWGWLNPVEWVLKPIKCAARWLFVPDKTALDTRLADLEEHTDDPPLQWAAGFVDLVDNIDVSFVRWRDADLPCMSMNGTEWCAAELDGWDFPVWLRNVFLLGLWMMIGYSVLRFL